jgi:hypothetical protein
MKYFHPFLVECVCFRLARRSETTDVTNLLWRERYAEAISELNTEELPAKIDTAEKAIIQRIDELEVSNENSEEERQALNDALRGLRVLAQAECRSPRSPTSDKRKGRRHRETNN